MFRKILAIAVPMALSNLTSPIVNAVDTAVIGHLDNPAGLGAIAMSGAIYSLMVWICGFLRMSTTGLAANAFGQSDGIALQRLLTQGAFITLCISAPILLFHQNILALALHLLQGSQELEVLIQDYFVARIWGTPAAIGNYVIMGWLLGLGDSKTPLKMLVIAAILNVILDLWFVYELGMYVKGVAAASAIAEWAALCFGLTVIFKRQATLPNRRDWSETLGLTGMKELLSLNRDVFIRSVALEGVFLFFQIQSAQAGDLIMAANAVLMNFFLFLAYGLDGLANAAEVLVGQAIGRQQYKHMQKALKAVFILGGGIAVFISLLYAIGADALIHILTDMTEVVAFARQYEIWMILMPIVCVGCFVWDGVFIGALAGRGMRNTMLLSTSLYFLCWFVTQPLGNHGLWLSIILFMIARTATMSLYWYWRKPYTTLFKNH